MTRFLADNRDMRSASFTDNYEMSEILSDRED